jgi:intracellular septation protein
MCRNVTVYDNCYTESMQWFWAGLEELLPIIVFFVVQLYYPFTWAVAAMLLSTAAILGLAWFLGNGFPTFAFWSTVAVLLFAIPTLVTADPWYFTLSDTIVDGVFALLLLASLFTSRNLLEYLFGRIFALPTSAWRILTLRWGIVLLLVAIGNEYVRLTYNTNVWSVYKLVSTLGLLVFGLWQFRLSARERIVGESNWLGLRV